MHDAVNVVTLALAQAERGELPVDLVQKAHVHARQDERVNFLTVLRQLTVGISSSISASEWVSLSRDASILELPDEVGLALLERAIELRPRDRNYRRYQLEALAHSESPARREKAREALLEHIGIVISDGEVHLPEVISAADITTTAVMLDAYHRDELDAIAFKITSALLAAYPNNSVVLRNHGRALREVGDRDAGRNYYRKALLASDADAVTASWFGGFLSSSDHVDAAEVFLYGCLLDPELANNFADAADELASALHMREIGRSEGRSLPDAIDKDAVMKLLISAFSCRTIDAKVLELAGRIVDTAELDPEFPNFLLELRRGSTQELNADIHLLNVRERLLIVREVYGHVASELTRTNSNLVWPWMLSEVGCWVKGRIAGCSPGDEHQQDNGAAGSRCPTASGRRLSRLDQWYRKDVARARRAGPPRPEPGAGSAGRGAAGAALI